MFALLPSWLRRWRRPTGLAVTAAIPTLVSIFLFWWGLHHYQHWELLLRRGELATGNFLRHHGRPAEVRPELVFLGIDDQSLKLDALWPEEIEASPALKMMSEGKGPLNWSREVYARLLDRLMAAGARLVVFDMVFPNPGTGDDAFRAALDRYRGRVIVGAQFVQTPGDESWQGPSSSLIADTVHDPRVGYITYRPDLDGAIRTLIFSTTQMAYNDRPPQPDDPVYDSLVAGALRQLGHVDLIPAGGQPQLFRYTVDGWNYPTHPFWEVFSDPAWEHNYQNGAFFKDKIILVGAAAPILHDFQPTPYGEIPGPQLHLQALAAALSRDFLRLTDISTDFVLIAAAGLLAWGVGLYVRPPLARLGAFAGTSVAFVAVLQWLYNRFGLMPLSFTPLLVFNLGGLSGLVGEYAVERAEKTRIRGVLDRLVSRDIVRELLADRDRYTQLVRGQRRCVTVLFSDIRGFTALSEGAEDPTAFVAQLNEYLTEMVDIVFKHRGTLDKFIGDSVMAVWGSVHTEGASADASQAVAAAVEMRERLGVLNAGWVAGGRQTFAVGIGVNYGEVIVGGLGSEKSKMEISIVGDAVNTASRLEGLTKEYGLDLLVGETVAQRVSDVFRLRTVDRVRVKGKAKPTEVMTVIGPLTEVPSEQREIMLADYEDAILLYRRRQFADAAALLESCLRDAPDDGLVRLYLTRCQEFLVQAPSTDWDAVRLMTSK